MAFTINKNAWHYKFLTWYTIITKQTEPEAIREWEAQFDKDGKFIGGAYVLKGYKSPQEIVWEDNYLPSNFCQYWRRTVINPLLRFGVNIASYGLCGFLLSVSISAAGYKGLLVTVIGVTAVVACFALLFLGLAYLDNKIPELVRAIKNFWRKTFIAPDDDNLIGMVYKTHKDNICVDVEYRD